MRDTTIGAIAEFLGCPLVGDPSAIISGVAPLAEAKSSHLAFIESSMYSRELQSTSAGLVLVREQEAHLCAVPHIICRHPKVTYAQVLTWLLDNELKQSWGIHPTVIVGERSTLPSRCSIGPYVVIGDDVVIGEDVVIDAGVVIGSRSSLGAKTHLFARVVLMDDVSLGERCRVHSGAVIGSAGFGFANDKGHWKRIPQVGGVIIGSDVDVGANTAIDCGAQFPTRIGNGVILDNLIQIGHNVTIGNYSAIAGCVAVAGSTTIGEHCMIGGGTCISGHIEICSGVHVTGMSAIAKSITVPGTYSSGTLVTSTKQWKRNVIRFNQLDEMMQRIRAIEKLNGTKDCDTEIEVVDEKNNVSD